VGTPRKIDNLTVEFKLDAVNPIFLQHISLLPIMSRAWAEKNKATKPLDFKNKEEGYASFHANGTGPFILVSRQPDVKTVYKRNPAWWGKFDGNVQEVVYTPIKSDATRVAALISGEIDLVLDPAPQDLPRLRNTPGVKVIEGPENRIVFIGMDQARDELLYSSVKGKNPFKDQRVRRALYQAIDIETIKTKLMRGQAAPTGAITPSPLGTYNDPALEKRLASMWARLNVKVRVNAMPRTTYFPKLQRLDTSMYMLGWGGAITDAETVFTPVLRGRGEGGVGSWNFGGAKDAKFEELAAASSKEADPTKREQLVKAALARHNELVLNIPLHRQVIPWAARANVEAVHRPDNWLEWRWVTLK
jgi:peptide/nickel transport system substrate-binding protein